MPLQIDNGTTNTCDRCGKIAPNMSQCSGCKEIRYCSRECQKIAWKTHKEFCNKKIIPTSEERPIYIFEKNAKLTDYQISPDFIKSFGEYERFLKIAFQTILTQVEGSELYGLKKKPKLVESLVQERNIKSVLLHIQAESDRIYLQNWLLSTIENWPHPLFFLKLGQSLMDSAKEHTKPKKKERFYIRSSAAKFTFIALTTADFKCYQSTDLPLISGCFFAYLLQTTSEEQAMILDQTFFNQRVVSLLQKEKKHLLKKINKLASPTWITGQMQYFFFETPILLPATQCRKIREKFIREELVDD